MSGNSHQRRLFERAFEKILEKRMGQSVPPKQDKWAKIYFWIGLFVSLGALGLPLIGVTVNVFLGGLFLAGAFISIVRAFWIWERELKHHVFLRAATVAIAGLAYFAFVGRQMIAEYKKEHSPVNGETTKPPPDPFTVSVEYARFSVGGKEYGTSLWIRYPSRAGGCTLSPIRGMYFLSIKNNLSAPVSVIGYTVDLMGHPLERVRTDLGTIVGTPNSIDGHFLHPGLKVSDLRPGETINFGQGPGFAWAEVPLNQSDYSRSMILKMDLIGDLLKNPLQPGVPIRGWALFNPTNENVPTIAGAGHVTLETDDSKTFSYEFNLRNPHPELDNMDRIIRIDSFVDLSDCLHP